MGKQRSATHGPFAHLLPPEEPCFFYAQRESEEDMPDVTSGISGLLQDAVLERAFPEEYEYVAVCMLLGACRLDANGQDAGGFDWKACNWGLIDRVLAKWYVSMALPRRLVAFKRLFGFGHGTARERMMRTDLWVFRLETTIIRVRAALEELQRECLIRRFVRYVDDYGAMAFYEFTPLFVERLRETSGAVGTETPS